MSAKKNRRKNVSDAMESEAFEQDEYFYFIAGCTEGGAPYGVTWEEHEAEQTADVIELNPINE